MRTKDVMTHYGTQVKIAEALNIYQSAVSRWGDTVPEGQAYKLQVITRGKLKVDPSLYTKSA